MGTRNVKGSQASSLLTTEPCAWTVGLVMMEAFKESAVRHWNDAKLLEDEQRFDNANQLVGFAAECAIKTALSELRSFAPEGELTSHYRVHINELWERALLYKQTKRYKELALVLKQPNPYHDWSVSNRYAADGTVSEEARKRHRDNAKRLLGIIGIKGTRAGSR